LSSTTPSSETVYQAPFWRSSKAYAGAWADEPSEPEL